jgi:hypothetical protein
VVSIAGSPSLIGPHELARSAAARFTGEVGESSTSRNVFFTFNGLPGRRFLYFRGRLGDIPGESSLRLLGVCPELLVEAGERGAPGKLAIFS